MDNAYYKGTLCWRCNNSVPDRLGTRGCSWSINLVPVAGWTAEPRTVMYDEKPRTTYNVILCPCFAEEKPRKIDAWGVICGEED